MLPARWLKLLLTGGLWCWPTLVIGEPMPARPVATAELLTQAEAAFHKGQQASADAGQARRHFQHAAELLELIRTRGVGNPAFFRNQGNAEFLAGRLPQAIRAFQRGLRLAPGDYHLRNHLEFARSQVQYHSSTGRPDQAPWPGWLMWVDPDLAFLVTLAVYAWACMAVTLYLMTRKTRWLVQAILCGLATVAAGLGWWLLVDGMQPDSRPLVVVSRHDVSLHRGNGTSYPRHPQVLPLGLEGYLLYRRGNWLQIQLPSGLIGWVLDDDVLLDELTP